MSRCRWLSLPNCHFFLFPLLFFYLVQANKEWMNSTPVEIFIPQNLQLGDELVAEEPLRIFKDADEQVAVSLFPASDAFSLAPGIVGPREVFRLILRDRDSLAREYKIQLLGVYSGVLQEVPLRFIFDNAAENSTLHFERDSYDLKLSTPLVEREILPIKMSGMVPSWAKFSLVGPLSGHFSAYSESGMAIVSSVPCQECVLDVPKQFSLLLTHEQHSTVLNFNVEQSYKAEMEEAGSEFKKVVKLKATGGKAKYSLDDPSGLFSVHPKSGMLTIQHPEFVFIDTIGESVTLNAVATDGLQKARSAVNIKILPKREINGFRFEKEEYKLVVPPGQSMADGALSLHGNWENVTYRLAEGPLELFNVAGGNLFYLGKHPKQDERFLLLVMAEAKLYPVAAVTRVDILVKGIGSHLLELVTPPSIFLTLSANEATGTLLNHFEVSDDDEDSKTEFSVAKVTARNFEGGIVDVPKGMVELVLERQKADLKLMGDISNNEWLSLEVVVEAKDAAHPLERPVYSHLEAFIERKEPIKKAELPLKIVPAPDPLKVPSNLPEGSLVYQIRTFPAENVTFFLENESDNFNVDEITGIISTNRPLRPAPSTQILLVTAKSRSLQTSKNFTIEITDSSEAVSKSKESLIDVVIPAAAEIGRPVADVAVMNGVSAEFASLEGSDLFLIDSEGKIVTAPNLSDEQANYALVARTNRQREQAMATVNVTDYLNVSKNLRFAESVFHFQVMQNLPLGGYVGAVHLVSKGNNSVQYSVQASEGEEQLMNIDGEGRMTLREELGGIGKSRKYRVTATEGPRTTTAEVEITFVPAFDCIPEFIKGENDIFYIDENIPSASVIGRVSAKPLDPKCALSFFFWDADRQSLETSFAEINAESGEIKSKLALDYENVPSFGLVLGLKAGQRQTAQHAAVLVVRDGDDYPIRFKPTAVALEVAEASPVGSLITTAAAVDPDLSQRVYYLLEQDGDEFGVDRETGEVRLAKALDREKEDRYHFEVGASNSPNSTEDEIDVWMTVKITVKDMNDNGPVFDRGHYEALLEKSALPGRTVIGHQLHAVDPDLHEGGASPRVYYSLADVQFEYRGSSRPMKGFFFIEQNSGEVVLLEPVHDFVGGVFHLQVQASDGLQSTANKNTASLRVIIHDDSDVVVAEILSSPENVQLAEIQNVTQSIAEATGLRVLVKEVGYHSAEGVVLANMTDLRMVLVDKSFEIAPAEKVIAIMKTSHKNAAAMPTVGRVQVSVSSPEESGFPSPLFIIGFIFFLLFLMVAAVLSLIICHYRAKYRREKNNFEDHRIIRNTLEQPYRRPTPPSPLRLPTAEQDDQMCYMSQERRLSVIPDEPRSKS